MDFLRPSRVQIGLVVLGSALLACGGPATTGGSSPATTRGSPTAGPTVAPANSVSPTLPPGILAKLTLDSPPSGIVAAGDYIWFEDHARTNAVYAIDPETGETAGSVQLVRPCDFVQVGDVLWTADLDASKLVAIDLETFEIVREAPGLAGPCGPVFTGGSIWLTVTEGLARVDPEDGTSTMTELDGGGAFPGTGKPLWAATYGSGDLHRINLETGASVLDIPSPGGQSEFSHLAIGFDSLWLGNEGTKKLYRLDPTTGEILAETPIATPARILVTADSVWVTSYTGGMVERVDPTTNEVVYRVRLGGNINGLAEGFGSIWVGDTLTSLLYRIDPAATGLTE
jgi:streptogramin lyase